MADQGAQHGQRIDDEMRDEVVGLIRGAPVDTATGVNHQSVPVALDSSGHSVRELLGFGVGLARGVLELADRALAAVQRGLEPGP